MSISFSGLASGLDTSSWITSLVALRQAKVTSLQKEKENILLSQETLTNIRSFFSSFRSMVEKVTETKLWGINTGIFAQKLATSSNPGVITATASSEAEEGVYNVLVDKLATNTQAMSGVKDTRTVVQTKTATLDTRLKDLGVRAGDVGILKDGRSHVITLEDGDRIADFIYKLRSVGVEANFNEQTAIFSLNLDAGGIDDSLSHTGIANSLHLGQVGGYESGFLQIESKETITSAATGATKLSELGTVNSGSVLVKTDIEDFELNINGNTTLQNIIDELRAKGVDANLSTGGVLTINDAEIDDIGNTGIIDVLGLEADINTRTQVARDLSFETIRTTTTNAATTTRLGDLEAWSGVGSDQKIVAENLVGGQTTITLEATQTLGELVGKLRDAGLSANLSNGVLTVSGGEISGAAAEALGISGGGNNTSAVLSNGNELLTSQVTFATGLTTLGELGIDTTAPVGGHALAVYDDDNNLLSEIAVSSGTRINDIFNALSDYGISGTISNGRITLNSSSGAWVDGSVASALGLDIHSTVVVSGTHVSGSDTVMLASREVYATGSTTFAQIGLNAAGKTLDIRSCETNEIVHTITIASNEQTFDDLFAELSIYGINASINNGVMTFLGENYVSGDLAESLGVGTSSSIVTITAGQSMTSNASILITTTIDADLSTSFAEAGLDVVGQSVEVRNKTTNELLGVITIDSNDRTFEYLFNRLNSYGITATMNDGCIALSGSSYITGNLADSLGISVSGSSSSSTLAVGVSSAFSVLYTTTGTAGTSATFADAGINAAGKTLEIRSIDGTNLIGTITIDSNSRTFEYLFDRLATYSIASSMSDGVITFTGDNYIAGGTLMSALGIGVDATTILSTMSTDITSDRALMYSTTTIAGTGSTFESLAGWGTVAESKTLIISKASGDNEEVATLTINKTDTIQSMINQLAAQGIGVTIENGRLSFAGNDRYISGGTLADFLDITTTTSHSALSMTTTIDINYTTTTIAGTGSTFESLNGWTLGDSGTVIIKQASGSNTAVATLTINKTETFQDLIDKLATNGINATMSNGQLSFVGNDRYISGGTLANFLGITSTSTTAALAVTSSAAIKYNTTVTASTDTTISACVSLPIARSMKVYSSENEILGTITIKTTDTFGSVFSQLSDYDITASLENGKISISGDNYVSGLAATTLGITVVNVTTTVGQTSTGTVALTKTITTFADTGTKVSDCITLSETATENCIKIGSDTYTITDNTTLGDMLTWMNARNANAYISNGVITIGANKSQCNIDSSVGTIWNKLGISEVALSDIATVANTKTSTSSVLVAPTTQESVFLTNITSMAATGIDLATVNTSATLATGTTYVINSIQGLQNLATLTNSGKLKSTGSYKFVLDADLDMTGVDWTPIGNSTSSTKAFRGTFYGNGHKIENLSMDCSGYYAGLFGNVKGTIQDLATEDVNINYTRNSDYNISIGMICGEINGQISNCTASGNVTVNRYCDNASLNFGGVVGTVSSGNIDNCYTYKSNITINVQGTGTIERYICVGGVVGHASNGVDSCIAYDNKIVINSTHSTANCTAGGVVGGQMKEIGNCFITNCASKQNKVSVNCAHGILLGGILGQVGNLNITDIRGCYVVSGTISANNTSTDITNVGGLVGVAGTGSVCHFEDCNVFGLAANVDATHGNDFVGGFIGAVWSNTLVVDKTGINCVTIKVTGTSSDGVDKNIGGIFGRMGGCDTTVSGTKVDVYISNNGGSTEAGMIVGKQQSSSTALNLNNITIYGTSTYATKYNGLIAGYSAGNINLTGTNNASTALQTKFGAVSGITYASVIRSNSTLLGNFLTLPSVSANFSATTKIGELFDEQGTIKIMTTSGEVTIVLDGTKAYTGGEHTQAQINSDNTLYRNDTMEEFMTLLGRYGINATITDKKLTLSGSTSGVYITSMDSNIASAFHLDNSNWYREVGDLISDTRTTIAKTNTSSVGISYTHPIAQTEFLTAVNTLATSATSLATISTTSTLASGRYRIDSIAELQKLATLANEGKLSSSNNYEFVLMKDLDLKGIEWTPIGKSSTKCFRGTFYGNGHEIKNLTITNSQLYTGLFGYAVGTIQDLATEDVNIIKHNLSGDTGMICGLLEGKINNCIAQGTVDIKALSYAYNQNIGGIVGSYTGAVNNCFVYNSNISYKANVVDNSERYIRVGGIAGALKYENSGTMTNCKAYNNEISCKSESTVTNLNAYAGGITGNGGQNGCTLSIQDCVSRNNNISADSAYCSAAGGVSGSFGNADGEMVNVIGYGNTINVSSKTSLAFAGGLIGHIGEGNTTFRSCKAASTSIDASSTGTAIGAGGLFGSVNSHGLAMIDNDVVDKVTINVSGTSDDGTEKRIGGVVGYCWANVALSNLKINVNITNNGGSTYTGMVIGKKIGVSTILVSNTSIYGTATTATNVNGLIAGSGGDSISAQGTFRASTALRDKFGTISGVTYSAAISTSGWSSEPTMPSLRDTAGAVLNTEAEIGAIFDGKKGSIVVQTATGLKKVVIDGTKAYEGGTHSIVEICFDRTLYSNDNMSEFIRLMNSFGIAVSINDGKLIFSGGNGVYIKSMDNSIAEVMHMNDDWYEEVGEAVYLQPVYGYSNSNTQKASKAIIADRNTKIRGLDGYKSLTSLERLYMSNITLKVNGTEGIIVLPSVLSTTIGDFLDALAECGIYGYLDSDGFMTLSPIDADNYIEIFGSSDINHNDIFEKAFGVGIGSGKTYTTSTHKGNASNAVTFTEQVQLRLDDTTERNNVAFSDMCGYDDTTFASNNEITIQTASGVYTVAVASTDTLDMLGAKLSYYGIYTSLGTDGKVTLTSIDGSGSYIKSIGSALQTILNIPPGGENYTYDTIYSNNKSTAKNSTNVCKLDDTSEFANVQFCQMAGYNASVWNTTANRVITTKGPVSNRNITLAATDTLATMAAALAERGITMSLGSDGKLTFTSTNGQYIFSVGSGIQDVLGITAGEDLSYDKVYGNSMRDTKTLSSTNTYVLDETSELNSVELSQIVDVTNSMEWTPGGDQAITIQSIKADNTIGSTDINVSRDQTLADLFAQLAANGITGTLGSDGKVTLSSTDPSRIWIQRVGTAPAGTLHLSSGENRSYQSSSVTLHDNTTSSSLSVTVTNTLTEDAKLGEIEGYTGGEATITIRRANGIPKTITLNEDTTIDSLFGQLAAYGIEATLDRSGRIRLNSTNPSNVWIMSMSDNLKDAFKFEGVGESYTYNSNSLSNYNNYGSNTYDCSRTVAATRDDKFSDLDGFEGGDGTVTIHRADGTSKIVTISPDKTIQEFFDIIGFYGLVGGIDNSGRVTIYSPDSSNVWIENMSDNLKNILNFNGVGNGYSYATSTNTYYNDTNSSAIQYTQLGSATENSVIQDLEGYSHGNGKLVVHRANGNLETIVVNQTGTVQDFFDQIARFGLSGRIDNDGNVTIVGNGDAYLQSIAGGSNILTALNLGAVDKNLETVNSNTSGVTLNTTDIIAATSSTLLSDLQLSNGTKIGFNAQGKAALQMQTVDENGVVKNTTITFSSTQTLGSVISALAAKGIDANLENRRFVTSSETLSDYTLGGAIGEFLGAAADTGSLCIGDAGNKSYVINTDFNSIETTTVDAAVTRETQLSELGVTTGEFYIYSNGVRYTSYISDGDTVGDLLNKLGTFGIMTSIIYDGDSSKINILGSGDSYVATSNSISNSSNVVRKLFGDDAPETTYNYSALEQTTVTVTSTQTATEETLIREFDTPWGETVLKSEGRLVFSVNNERKVVSIGKDETFGSLIDKLENIGVEATFANGRLYISDLNDTFILAPACTSSIINPSANIHLNSSDAIYGFMQSTEAVTKTETIYEDRTLSASNYANLDTQLGTLNISSGSLSIYRNGKKAVINVNKDLTFSALRSAISGAFSEGDIDLKFDDGKLVIYSTSEGVDVHVGATTDGSNFCAITGMDRNEAGEAVSARALYCANADMKVTTNNLFRNGNVTEGTFTIGNEVFTIDSNTTLADLISQINSSDEVNATAYWDNLEGKFVIKSRNSGAAYINIEAGTSNFTDIMGFTHDDGGISRMDTDMQEMGTNARVTINGTSFTATSNVITSDISKIKGLTINLNGLSEGSAVTLKVEKDKETVSNAVSDIVDSYNELMKNVDEAIASDGKLHDQSMLKIIRNRLRNLMTSSIGTTGVYKNLSSIGISVGAASGSNLSTSNESIINLTFDKDKFDQAYTADSDSVRELLIGLGIKGAEGSTEGVFSMIDDLLDNALGSITGYFDTADASFSKKVSNLDRKIDKANEAIEKYRERLQKKFNSMDMLIANMQQQYTSFLGR